MNECYSAGHLSNLSHFGNAFRKGAPTLVSTHSQLHSAILPAAQSRCLSFLAITLFPPEINIITLALKKKCPRVHVVIIEQSLNAELGKRTKTTKRSLCLLGSGCKA